MSFKSKILFSLYQRLKLSPCSIPQLRLWKQANQFDISDRTLYRYLNELDIVVASKFGEMLEVVHLNNRRKQWKISPLNGLVRAQQPSGNSSELPGQGMIHYKFGQAIMTREASALRELVESAIEANAQLVMDQGIVVAYEEVFPDDVILPLQIIRHQCMDHLCFYHERNRKIQTAPISSMAGARLDGGHFSPELYQVQLAEFFDDHFGIAPNIDDAIYPIEIIFSEQIGKTVVNYHWHSTQRFETLSNGDLQLNIKCGLNEELVQWVLKFTDQVTVIKPQILIDKLVSQYSRAIQHYSPKRGSDRLHIAS